MERKLPACAEKPRKYLGKEFGGPGNCLYGEKTTLQGYKVPEIYLKMIEKRKRVPVGSLMIEALRD